MPINLTGSTIASTYDQLLHVDDGPTATEKTVYSGTGVATALKVGTQSASVDNVQLDGNTIRTLDGNGNLVLAPNGTGSVAISKVAITGGTINGITDLGIADGGTGASTASDARTNLGLGTMATQAANNVAITGGTLSGVVFTGSFTGLTLVESATLATSAVAVGVNLNGNTLAADGTDTNIDINITPKGTGRTVVGALSATSPRVVTGVNDTNGNELLKVTATASAVNELTLANAATGSGPTLSATGDDTNIDINITPKGTGEVNITKVDIDDGAIDGTTIGANAVATIKGSTVLATQASGYAAGAGGTVTQLTSRTTGVTLNQACGEITLVAGTLAGHEADEFDLTNSEIAASDVVIVNIKSGAAAGTRKYYTVGVTSVSAGSCTISIGNHDNGSLPAAGTDTLVLSFAVIKGVTS
jgi:hypothetical protein